MSMSVGCPAPFGALPSLGIVRSLNVTLPDSAHAESFGFIVWMFVRLVGCELPGGAGSIPSIPSIIRI